MKDIYCRSLILLSAAVILFSFHGCRAGNVIRNEIDNSNPKIKVLGKEMREILSYTVMAASGHNTQPWKYKVDGTNIKIYPDYSRRLPVVDGNNRELFISLGCALENMIIAAREYGYDANITFDFKTEGKECINVELRRTERRENPLFNAIPLRQCTRNEYTGAKVSESDLAKIKESCRQEGADMFFYTDNRDIEKLIVLVKDGNNIQLKDDRFMGELKSWIRFSKSESAEKKDGLKSASFDNPTVPRWIGSFFMNFFLTANSQNEKDEKCIKSSAGLLLITTNNEDKESWINAGRLYERFALAATSMDIKNAFMNQPVEINELRHKLTGEFNLKGKNPQLLIRFGYSAKMTYSNRRNLEDVLL